LSVRSATWYDAGKEVSMIELREDQLRALDAEPQPPVLVDPRTGQEYLLIKREVYDLVSGILKPYNRGWDPDEELIRKNS
jgi:hypothetical protein